jgi:hypothetical protein
VALYLHQISPKILNLVEKNLKIFKIKRALKNPAILGQHAVADSK